MSARLSDIESRIDSMFGTSDPQDDNNNAPDTQPPVDDNVQVSGGEASQQEQAAPRDGGTSDRRAPQSGAQHERGQQDTPPAQPAQRRLPANNAGDLIDPNTGAVVARAGNERRYYEAARTAQQNVQRITGELERTTTELHAFREAATLPRELGLAPAEVTNAMQWFAHWKQNPVEAATKVLTELRAMGYEIEGLGGQIDMAALRHMVQEAVSPFKQDRDAAQQQYQAEQQISTELNALYSAFPWAREQQQELVSLLQADPTLTLREAALHLRAYAAERGYDLQKPLRAQVLAAQNGPQRANNARMPAPSTTSDAPLTPRRTTSGNHDLRNRDIVREAMREAGLNVDNL